MIVKLPVSSEMQSKSPAYNIFLGRFGISIMVPIERLFQCITIEESIALFKARLVGLLATISSIKWRHLKGREQPFKVR